MKIQPIVWIGVLLGGLLSGCGTGTTLSDASLSGPTLEPTGNGENVSISYRIGQESKVWVYLQDGGGQRYALRDGQQRQPSTDPYVLRFDGTVPVANDANGLVRRLLPDGQYACTVEAESGAGKQQQGCGTLTIRSGNAQPPLLENLLATPATISPNADGVDDETEITYQLPVTATVNITIAGPDGTTYPFVTDEEQSPEPQRRNWNGKTLDGAVLPDGQYTYTVRAQDEYGNIVQRNGQVAIQGGGQPEMQITLIRMAPESLMRGDVLTVTLRVKNVGDVPIRTYGPPSGYEYSTDQVFSSVENGAFAAKPGGYWRVGVDWDANSGGAAKRYPYRWAVTPRTPAQWKVPPLQGDPLSGEDVLMPGEEAEIIGRIRVDQPETRMGFYGGLIQDGVGFFQDKIGRTIINVGF